VVKPGDDVVDLHPWPPRGSYFDRALATPHAGVGDSSIGDELLSEELSIPEPEMCGDRCVGLTGEIMTKSSSCGADR
jgi:hypothetical protein